MANQILRHLDCPALPDRALNGLAILIGFEMPVHPAIARHFGVEHIDENTRCRLEGGRLATFAEYIRDYVYFT
jgi:hypothetical protein